VSKKANSRCGFGDRGVGGVGARGYSGWLGQGIVVGIEGRGVRRGDDSKDGQTVALAFSEYSKRTKWSILMEGDRFSLDWMPDGLAGGSRIRAINARAA
jgi:hypothetical protein